MAVLRVVAVFLLVAAAYSSAQINPLKNPEICGRPTCQGLTKFFYNPGIQYTYDYSVSVSTLFRGTSTNSSTLQFQATVTLDFRSKCDGLLTVTDLTLTQKTEQNVGSKDNGDHGQMESDANEGKRSELFQEAVTAYPMRFAFNDGQIYELCPDEDETNWVMNFKRGILSMIHNTMSRFDLDHQSIEDDVRGRCMTKYFVEGGEGTSLIITKEKDLGSCERRSKLHSMIQSVPYRFRREHDDRLLKSGSTCKLSIDHHIYNDIKCTEVYLFQPFDSDTENDKDKGASTVVHQRLRLTDESHKAFDEQPAIERRVPLLYDPVPTPKPTSGELKASRDLVKKLCRLSDDDVQTEFSDLFTKFIHTARMLSQPALTALYNHAGTICPTGKKHVRDALPYLTSSGAVAQMADLIIQGEVPERNMHEWMLAVALIARPDDAMLESMLRLLQVKPLDANVVLAVSALTYTYCQQRANCQTVDQAADVIQELEERVADMYRRMNGNDTMIEHQMLVVLKALSNIGSPSEDLISNLRRIISDDNMSMAVRLAAIDCHRRFPCLEHRKYFDGVFRDINQDPELRIAAYLQVMRCPNYIIIQSIRQSLETEEVNQVSSFIWSHLKNLLKSAIPSRVEIQGLLSDADLRDKFSRDIRKYSHNYEGSVFFEQYNVGSSYESNVIFSPSSYIPKFGMFNLTVDLFGESINMFELYGRVEGFEHFFESLFGPRGPLNSKKFDQFLPKMRWAREANDYNRIQKELDNIPNVITHDFNAPRVSLGLKVFGNELKYATFHGLNAMRDTINEYNPIDHLKKLLSGKEISYNKAAMFLDTSYVVPTAAGLPLTLNAVGTSSINLKMSGSLTPANFWQARELNLTGSIQPSIAVDIMGTMSVDAYYAATAIKIKTNVYTSSAVEGSVVVKGSKLVSVKFSIPKRAMEIFGAKSELVVMNRDLEEILQAGNTKDRSAQTMCSWPAVDNSIGLKLCMDYYFVNETNSSSSFLLAGPAAFRVALLKSDPTAVTYMMEYKWVNTTNGSQISLIFDTPGSTIRRLLGANLTLDRDSQNLTLLLESTEGTVLARGKYKNTPTEKYMQVGLDINGQRKFDAQLSLEQKEVRNGHVYVPKLYLGVNAVPVAELEGVLKYVTKGGVSQCDVNLKFKTKRLQSKLFGYISRTSASFRSNLKLEYQFANAAVRTVVTEFYTQDRSTPAISTFLGEASLITTAYPNYNFNSSLKFQKSAGHVECKLQLNSSPHLKEQLADDPEQLTVDVYITYRALINSTRFNSTVTIGKQISGLDMRGQLTYDLIGRTHDVQAMARYARDKDIHVTIYYARPRQTLDYIEARLNVSVPNFKPMLLETRIKEKNTKDSNVDISATWFSGHEITLNGVYADKSWVRAANHHLKMFIQSPSFDEINGEFEYYRNSTDFKIDLKATQVKDNYEFYVKHSKPSADEMLSLGKIKYKNQVYSVSTSVSLKEERRLSLELHLDQYRNIVIAARGYNKKTEKAAGMEIKWDANRDPDQKLAIGVLYHNPAPYNHEAEFDVSYPGRTIKGVFDFTFVEGQLSMLGQMAWSPDDAFAVRVRTKYKFSEEIFIRLQTDLTTPFEEWKKSILHLGFHHLDNMYRVNGSLHWQQNEHIITEFYGDYLSTDDMLHCEYKGMLESTVIDIPSLSARLKHNQNATKVITLVKVTYHPQQILSVNSTWAIDEDATATNLTGTVLVNSPFQGLNKGLLVSKIKVTNTRDLRAVVDANFDQKKFAVSVEGHMQKLSKSMLQFNITSPIEKFRLIQGRFGFSEENRHLVAMVVHPTGSLGIEVQFLVRSLSNFNTKFHLGTPIDFLQEIMFVAKMQPDEADFRVRWNLLLAGFKGAWHYSQVTDFEYAYHIYTPIEGVEESGVVARLILRKGLDSEFSVQFGDSRLGISVLGQPQPQTLKELGIKTQDIYKESNPGGLSNEYNDQTGELDRDPFSWLATVRIDSLVYSTIEANVEIDQKGTLYDTMATLTLPHGIAELKNKFDFKDVRTMTNRLTLSTPYGTYKEVTSDYELRIMAGHQYLFALDFNYLNGSRWIKTGGRAHYHVEALSSLEYRDDKQYNISLHLHTPMVSFPFLDTAAAFRRDGVSYAADFYVRSNKSNVQLNADAELRGAIVDAHLAGHIQTSMLTLPPVTLYLHKNSTAKEHKVNVIFDMPKTKSNKFVLASAWHYDSWRNFHMAMDMQTPFGGMEESKAIVVLTTKDNAVVVSAIIDFHPLQLDANGSLRGEHIQGLVQLAFNGKRQKIELDGVIQTQSKDFRRNLNVIMSVNGVKHKLAGSYMVVDNTGAPIQYDIFSKDDVPTLKEITVSILNTEEAADTAIPLQLEYKLRKTGSMIYNVDSSLKHGAMFIVLAGSGTVAGWLNSKINFEVDTSHHQYKRIIVMMLTSSEDGETKMVMEAQTPFVQMQNPKIQMTHIQQENNCGKFFGTYELGVSRGNSTAKWCWLVLEKMQVNFNGHYERGSKDQSAVIEAFYNNPEKSFKELRLGGLVLLNDVWTTSSNLSVALPGGKNFDLETTVQLPPPTRERHFVRGKFMSDKQYTDIDYIGKYVTKYSSYNYGSTGRISYSNRSHIHGNVEVEWSKNLVRNYLDVEKQPDNVTHVLYSLHTPKYEDQAVVLAKATYKKWNEHQNITCNIFYPENRTVAVSRINFKAFANMDGYLNVTTPFKGFNYAGADFHTETTDTINNRYVQAFWPNKTAVADSKCITATTASAKNGEDAERRTNGVLIVEVPLTTRHIARVDYGYTKKPLLTTGTAIVHYKDDKVLEGLYNCVSERRSDADKDTIRVELQNKWWPVGADYIHGTNTFAPKPQVVPQSTKTPGATLTEDYKWLHVYHLYNRSDFNVSGELQMKTTTTGQNFTLAATQSNQTVRLWTNYDVLDTQFRQQSRIELEPNAWLAYNINLTNKTVDEQSEAQAFQIDVIYPRRQFTTTGSYNASSYALSTDVSLAWEKAEMPKSMQGSFNWKRDPDVQNKQEILFAIKHPSFDKNITFLGEYESTPSKLADIRLTIEYSPEEESKVEARALIENKWQPSMRNISYGLWAKHGATSLDLELLGGIRYRPRLYKAAHNLSYRRTYLPTQIADGMVCINLDKNEIEIKRETVQELTYFWSRYEGAFPLYTANISAIKDSENSTGEFYLNFFEKLLKLEINLTTDGSQSIHMFGSIPDARSASFDIWEDYDDIHISDIAYYLRMNHSRLVISSLRWRPELKQEIKDAIRKYSVDIYNESMDKMEAWRQYIRSETADAIRDIWSDAEKSVQGFIDDLRDLRVIEEDLEELKMYLNESYNANVFYVRNVTDIVLYMVDELSIRSHLASLPAFFREVWDVMGESGKKIQKSILWVIEKIKGYYKKSAEFINGLFQGDSVEHLSEALSQLAEKYDSFIKGLHVAFIQYMERLWQQTYNMLIDNWHKTLSVIEPTFIQLVHYLEKIAVSASEEFLDFLYVGKDLTETPYFSRIANFTHDLDRFYTEITGNDTLSATYKYAMVAWHFVQERFVKLVPFGTELKDVISEIWTEVYELRNLPSVQFLLEKYNAVEERVRWFCNRIDLENQLHRFIQLIHQKVTDMKRTALQSENRYREAKTKFIFEPADGIMLLENKLPMSWHAFNETPMFEEIPEYKALTDLQDYFSSSNSSLSTLYYDYTLYLTKDPHDLLPPFKAQAMIAGSRHIVTYDRLIYDLTTDGGAACTYLLTSDFVDGNFSVAVSPITTKPATHELLIVVRGAVIYINVFTDTVRIGDNTNSHLPVQLDETIVYEEADIVHVESALGFELECNLKFDVCVFEVSGWYFGKTAGLWGTMNNERSDDLLTPRQHIKPDASTAVGIPQFAHSWKLGRCIPAPGYTTRKEEGHRNTNAVTALCESLFGSTMSPFLKCFPKVPESPFHEMCLSSSTEAEACTTAVAYMNLCAFSNIRLRIPDTCVECYLPNGTVVQEGRFVSISGDSIPRSADVVFILEGKECNADVRTKRRMDTVVFELEKEMKMLGITNNRYSLVVFGGSGVFDAPRSVAVNSRIFTDHISFPAYFDNIPKGDGNLDIFNAITYASKLIFRPAVAKTFIMLPCTDCAQRNMKLDYTIPHQLLLENDITLHILMNGEFRSKKARESKIFFGLDRTLAYTRKDADNFRGDRQSRKYVYLPKENLRFCTSLAWETNGTVFSAKKLEKPKLVTKMAQVFAKRVAQSVLPNMCKTCECTAYNSGVSYMECLPCSYPSPASIDYGFDEDEMLSNLQSIDDDIEMD